MAEFSRGLCALLLAAALPAGAATAQQPPARPDPNPAQANMVAQQTADIRLAFGIVSNNAGFIRGALASDARGSIEDRTSAAPQTRRAEGSEQVAALIGGLSSVSGEIRDMRCAPGPEARIACTFGLKQRRRRLDATMMLSGGLVSSINFTVTGKR